MVNAKLEAQRQTIKHYWLNGAKSAKEIHKITNIPLRTVENNLQKLRETGTVEHKRGNGRKTKVTQTVARVIGQNIRRNNVLSTRQLAAKVENTQNMPISHVIECIEGVGFCNKTMIQSTRHVLPRNFSLEIQSM